MTTASLVVDLRKMRCGNCKVAIQNEWATKCPVCGTTFDRISSNHAGLADKLRKKRNEAGIDAQ